MQICCAGEVMVELAARGGDASYQRGFAGDSFNTAVYLARAGYSVDYLTRLGADPLSMQIMASLEAEGVGTGLITLCPGRQPGLYLIDNDDNGERHFSYWRDQSPAREMFNAPLALTDCTLFYFTGITLAITRSSEAQLLTLLQQLAAQGCRIVFDPNYRPRLWQSAEQARASIERVLPFCHTVLPTLEDETALWGFTTVEQVDALYREHGVTERVIKGAALTTHVCCDDINFSQQATAVDAIDTTGAGDSFNAGYLGARLNGQSIEAAVTAAQKLSAQVVQQRGAIISRP
ncbi:MAG: 2-dehydro-3-deoxygluconokinase [Bacteroidia bacterium]|jgi:2-dehydro-3-deoxygluconokinase